MKRDRRLLLVGQSTTAELVKATLANLEVMCEDWDWSGGPLAKHLAVDVIGLVLVAPPAGRSMVEATERCRRQSALPLLVVVSDETSDRSVRQIYRAGASAVFEWPKEAGAFADLVAQVLGLSTARGRATSADVALARTARAHLRVLFGPDNRVKLTAREGTIFVSGTVPALWHKYQLEEALDDVPGVRGVRIDEVSVSPTSLPDKQVKRAVRAVLAAAQEINAATLTLEVDRGVVTLAGSVATRRELQRVESALAHVVGVRELRNLATVSKKQNESDTRVARRLSRAVNVRTDQEAIELSVFGGVAVLSGRVDDPAARRRVERIARGDPSVDRVLNKLEVA